MRSSCPRCGSQTTKVTDGLSSASAAFCKNCGWGAALAAKKMRSDLGSTWIAALFGVAIAIWLGFRSGAWAGLMVGSAFILLPVSMGLLTKYRIGRVEKIRDRFADARDITSPVPAQVQQFSDESRYLQRPRRVQLRLRGWLYLAAGAGGTVLVALLFRIILQDRQAFQSLKGILALFILGLNGWLCVSFFRNRWRERRLFSQGCFASGLVLSQAERRSSLPRITYTFRDLVGRQFQTTATDFSRELYEEMPIHVFYDEQDPMRSAVLEARFFG